MEPPKSVPCAIGSMPAATADRGAARRSGRAQCRIPWIAGRAEQRVVGVSAGGEFRRVGLCQHDGAGGFEPAHRFGVFRRHIVLVQRRGVSGADASGRRDVLDADRQAMQRTERRALHHRLFGAPGGVARLFGGQRHNGVEFWIERCNRCDIGVEHFDRAYRARRNQPRQFAGRFAQQSLVGHGAAIFPTSGRSAARLTGTEDSSHSRARRRRRSPRTSVACRTIAAPRTRCGRGRPASR